MKRLMIIACVAWAAVPLWAQQQASVKETVQTVKTYPFSDPDPAADPTDMYYPYFRFDGFSAEGVDQRWKTVELENDYIRLSLYPEVGGKIWGAIDKTTGQAFIYNNHVVKFRDIAMRGPWTSGGIEFNFGIIGHVPTSSTPIDYYTAHKEDGSASCYIASYEWVTRTYWCVEVNLPKDKAYFTTTTTWFNQSDLDQPYYQWMNAGYKAAGKAHFCYPGNSYIGHGGELASFPKDEQGRDLSWYDNNNFGSSKSEHVLGFYNDFYGIYWQDDNYGSVHHAGYDEKLGMKIFLWGQARDGGIWEQLLTDTDGQYIELQSGRMYNQPASNSAYSPFKHYAFGPGMTDRWTEYWYPVKGIGGISKASRIGALHVTRETNGTLQLAFSPLAALSTEVKIYDGEQLLKQLPMQIQVLEPWTQSLSDLGRIPEGRLRVEIGQHDLVYTEVQDDYLLNRPKQLPEDFDWNSAYGLYTQGEQWMNQKYNDKAEHYLLLALEKDAYFAPALNRLASLYYRQGRWEDALGLLKRALSLNAYDGEANYLYGLCNRAMEHTADAKDGFSVATYSPAFRSAAYAQLAEMNLKEQDWKKAEHYAQKSLDYNRLNLDARQVLMVVYRKTERLAEAQQQIKTVLADLPLYHFARWEQLYGAAGTGHPMDDFQSLVRNELPFETYLELAGWYESVGCYDEALALLSCAGSYPIACYKRAYLLDRMGKSAESQQLLQQAATASPEMVFPFRVEDRAALVWAAAQTDDWKPRYYQGLIAWANQQKQEALHLLEACGQPAYAPFYLTRAKLRQLLPDEAKGSVMEDLLAAEQTDRSWRTGFELIKAYTDQQDWQKVVEIGKRYMKSYPTNYYIGLKLAKGYCETAQYAACIQLLKRMQVLPNEGAYTGRAVYRAANLYEAMDYLQRKNWTKAARALTASLEWPENLGVGKPYDDQIDSRLENYLQSRVCIGRGEQEQARQLLQQVVDGKRSDDQFVSAHLLTALALRELGREAEANQWVASWKQQYPDNRIVAWSIAVYEGRLHEARMMLAQRDSETDTTPWETSYRDVDFDLIARYFTR